MPYSNLAKFNMKKLMLIPVWLISFSIIIGQTWIRQNPFPELAQLYDINMDGNYGLAVGQKGVIFTTNNKGVTWVPRLSPVPEYSYSSALVVPGTNGQQMYAGGLIVIYSEDGGANWEIVNGGINGIHHMQMLPGGYVMAHGQQLSIYQLPGADEWEVIELPASGEVSAAWFTDPLHGWAESGNFNQAQVWHTSDGGLTWNVLDPLMHPVINSIQMLNDQVGFMAARDYVYKTTDGGINWIQLNQEDFNSIQDMYVVNEDVIWTCLINGFVQFSLDGGQGWQEINPNVISTNKTNGVYATEAGEVWLTGRFVSILHSANFGQDWKDQIPNAKSIMYRPHFIDEDNGMIGGSAGTILITNNGGASFEKLDMGEDENFFAVQMLTPSVMIAGSSSGNVFITSDGGVNWNMKSIPFNQIVDIHAFDAMRIIVVSESGKIFKTTNGGDQWDEVYASPFGLLQGVDFVDENNGWACGWFGTILHTNDAGDTWTPQNSQGNAQFTDIHFASATEGWAVSGAFSDSLYFTNDGGTSWEKMQLPFSTFWQGLSFHSPDTGWIAGGSSGSGIVIRTNDHGLTWTLDHQSPEALFGIHAVPGIETVWASGVGGNVIKYSPCTFDISLTNLSGPDMPCQRDTVVYEVQFNDVDIFNWTFPSDWLVLGNTNTSQIELIIGQMAGQITVAGTDGCGNTTSSVAMDVQPVATPQATIAENNDMLVCDLDSGFYQWLLNGAAIPGANEKTFTPSVSGEYACVVTAFATGCESRSNEYFFIVSSTAAPDEISILCTPNPAQDFISITSNASALQIQGIQFINASGNVCKTTTFQTHQIAIADLAAGVYVMRMLTNQGVMTLKLVKL